MTSSHRPKLELMQHSYSREHLFPLKFVGTKEAKDWQNLQDFGSNFLAFKNDSKNLNKPEGLGLAKK